MNARRGWFGWKPRWIAPGTHEFKLVRARTGRGGRSKENEGDWEKKRTVERQRLRGRGLRASVTMHQAAVEVVVVVDGGAGGWR